MVTAFLRLEYSRRGTLKKFITKVDDVTLLRWMVQVAKGLHDMHQVGIIHGDLKPENVIIMESGWAKIIDLAQSGYTTPYHAPEFPDLFESKGEWHCSVDIYSFGVVYWRMLFGTADELPQPDDQHSSPVIKLIAECVSTNPLERPSAQHVIDTLEHHS